MAENIPQADREILRNLAKRIAEIAALPVHAEKAALWSKLNQLQSVRPMVWISFQSALSIHKEVCWNELNVDNELTLQCTDEWCRVREDDMRKLIYQWTHMPGDMVVDDFLSCPLVIRSTGIGIEEDVDVVRTDQTSDIVSRHFKRQIHGPEDVEKIKTPRVVYDQAATETDYQKMCELFEDILPVKKVGLKETWFAPWDELVMLWGVEQAMMDMATRPEMVHQIISRLVDVRLAELDQWEELNLLALNSNNTRIGSGAYGYTEELPGEGFDIERVRTQDMWGNATAQIFSEISPQMHWEFALKHEMRWLGRWGLTYYGCCEPLDGKMDLLRRIPNLRKVSMSPWIDIERAVSEVGGDYVFSYKPNPGILAGDRWHPDRARAEIRAVLERARGCHVEIVMKDISTVRYRPQRLWQWQKMAMELAEELA